jgi:Xaa-Pro aminopeptidase
MRTLLAAAILSLLCAAPGAFARSQAEIDRERALKSEQELDRIKHLVARDAKRMERAKKAGDTAGEAHWHAQMEKHHAQAKRQKRKVNAERKRAERSEERERAAREAGK